MWCARTRSTGLRPRPQRQLAQKRRQQNDPEVREFLGDGCDPIMHLVRLDPRRSHPDIEATRARIRARWPAGVAHARRVLAENPWEREVDPLQGLSSPSPWNGGSGPA
jgi:hypothetical protein